MGHVLMCGNRCVLLRYEEVVLSISPKPTNHNLPLSVSISSVADAAAATVTIGLLIRATGRENSQRTSMARRKEPLMAAATKGAVWRQVSWINRYRDSGIINPC